MLVFRNWVDGEICHTFCFLKSHWVGSCRVISSSPLSTVRCRWLGWMIHDCCYVFLLTDVRDWDHYIYIREWSEGVMAGGFAHNGKPVYTDGKPPVSEYTTLQEEWEIFGKMWMLLCDLIKLNKSHACRPWFKMSCRYGCKDTQECLENENPMSIRHIVGYKVMPL